MAAGNIIPVNRTPTTTLAKGFGPVPAGKEWLVDVRVCASGNSDDTLDLYIRKTDGSNGCYRAKAHGVAAGAGTQDLELKLRLTAGFELWDRSAGGNLDVSYTGAYRDVPA